MPRRDGSEMTTISFYIPKSVLEEVRARVRSGEYPSKDELIRQAILMLILRLNRSMCTDNESEGNLAAVQGGGNNSGSNAAVYAPESLVKGVLSAIKSSKTDYVSVTSLGLNQGDWIRARLSVRVILNALMSIGFIKSYRFTRGSSNSWINVVVDPSKPPRVVVARDVGIFKAFIEDAIIHINKKRTMSAGSGLYTYRFTPRLITSWFNNFIDGSNTLIVIDPRIAYENLTKVLTQMREQGSVVDFGFSDEWLKPYPSINKSSCWFTYKLSRVPLTVIERVKELLREFVSNALTDPRYKVNVKHSNSPVLLTLRRFREFVWDVARNDPALLPLITCRRGRGGSCLATIGNTAPGIMDVIATVWVNELEPLLHELQRRGEVLNYDRDCTMSSKCRFYIVPRVELHE